MDPSFALVFQNRARLSRAQLGVDTPALRPTSAQEHVDIAVPGYAGFEFHASGLCLLSVNPAGGKANYQPTPGDFLIFEAAAALAVADAERMPAELERLSDAFTTAMPDWGSQWQHVSAILTATGLSLSSIAYLYLVPFRTKDDAGSRLPRDVLETAARCGLFELLDRLAPGQIITMDRPAERVARDWTASRTRSAEVLYYSRKRDNHAGRAQFLRELENRRRV